MAAKNEERIQDGRRVRDVYVNLKENESFGRIRFGAAMSSNEGLVGDITLVRSNFDIADLPTSFKDLFVDRTAFLGAGQYFSVSLQPGLEYSNFSINFSEPYLFGTPTALGLSAYLWQRQREDWVEQRAGGRMSLARRLPCHYTIALNVRAESVDIRNIDDDAPQDVKNVRGTNMVYGTAFTLTKDELQVDRFFKPYGGYKSFASIEPVFGDFSLVKYMFGSTRYRTIYQNDEGFRHIIKLEGEVGWITGNAPVFERYYLGGGEDMRGFKYRGVGPMQSGDPVGGKSVLFGTAEYTFPLIGDTIRGVMFFDFGTVNEDTFSYGNLRASLGVGVRVFSEQIPIPIALDLGFPIKSESGDEKQVISFSIGTNF